MAETYKIVPAYCLSLKYVVEKLTQVYAADWDPIEPHGVQGVAEEFSPSSHASRNHVGDSIMSELFFERT